MARIRSLKPEFHTDEQVMELTRDARLLFISMWNFCDDAGIHPASVKTLKAEVFPADDLTSADVQRYIDELIQQDLIIFFEVAGKGFWQVTGWHHQKIDRPSYKYPTPSEIQASSALDEHSTNDRRTLDEDSPPEGRGGEGKGEELKPLAQDAGANAASKILKTFTPQSEHRVIANNLGLDLNSEAEKFIDHYQANGETRVDWGAQFRKWLRKAPECGSSKYTTGKGPPPASGKQAARNNYAASAAAASERMKQDERPVERDITGQSERIA